jgi:hypothetical protein
MQELSLSWNGRFVLAACLASLLTLAGGQSRARAQEGQGKYITESTVRLIKLVDAGNKDGYSLQNDSFSIGGGWLKKSQSTWIPLYTIELKEGKKYRFLAAGDADAKDVDIQVVHAESNKVVAEDVETDATAKVDFTPKLSGRYQVRIRLYDSANNVPCVCLAVVMSKD